MNPDLWILRKKRICESMLRDNVVLGLVDIDVYWSEGMWHVWWDRAGSYWSGAGGERPDQVYNADTTFDPTLEKCRPIGSGQWPRFTPNQHHQIVVRDCWQTVDMVVKDCGQTNTKAPNTEMSAPWGCMVRDHGQTDRQTDRQTDIQTDTKAPNNLCQHHEYAWSETVGIQKSKI